MLVLTACTINFLLALALFGACIYVIFKYLLQVDRKLFVTLHYIFAVPLAITGMITSVAIYMDLPEPDDPE